MLSPLGRVPLMGRLSMIPSGVSRKKRSGDEHTTWASGNCKKLAKGAGLIVRNV